MINSRFDLTSRFAVAACCGCLVFASFAQEEVSDDGAKSDPAMEEELLYASLLIDNYPSFAGSVIEGARKRWAEAGPRLTALEMRALLRMGKFDAVKDAIKKVDKAQKPGDYWAMNLSLADAYYAQGDMKACQAIYETFFKEVEKPAADIRVLYVESAYKWGQMLVREKRMVEATKVYDSLLGQLKGDDNRLLWAQVALDDTEMLLKLASEEGDKDKRNGYLDRGMVYLKKLLWMSDEPLYFGRAVAMRAHVEVLRGKLANAKSMVETYIPQLKKIHEALAEQDPDGKFGYLRQSPMPQCRFLLAEMMWKEAKAELAKPKPDDARILDILFGEKNKDGKRVGGGAYNNAINVAVKYPESTWAGAADEMEKAIRALVKERFNREIKAQITEEQRLKILELKFKDAHELYANNDFQNAAPKYEQVLAQVPESVQSVRSVANLINCWINMAGVEKDAAKKDELLLKVEAAEGYLSERFSGLDAKLARAAGDQTLLFASREHDRGALARSQRLYDNYFRNFPTHHQAAQMAMSLAGQAYKNEDYETAMRYYKVIAESYTNSPHFLQALGQLSVAAGKMGDGKLELEWLRKYTAYCNSPVLKANAQLRLSYAQQREGIALVRSAQTEENEEQATELRKKGRVYLVQAAREFGQLVKDAEAAAGDASLSATDKQNFQRMREDALYLIGDSIQRMPAEGSGDPRLVAAQKYEKYLEAYPKGRYAPVVLVKLGTIYIATTNTVKQQEVFQRLEKDFPDSDEAKNSKPRLARTLMEMGLVQEGLKQYAEMVRTDGKYTATQFLQAGDAMLESGGKDAYDTAITAYDKSVQLANNATNLLSVIGRARIGKARALVGANRLVEAQELLNAFMEDKNLNRTTLVLEANMMLIETSSKAGEKEKDDATRERYFTEALKGLSKAQQRVKGDVQKEKELHLLGGDILVRRLNAELAMGLKEQAELTRGNAIGSYRGYLMGNEPNEQHPASEMKPWELANLEHAYSAVLPLLAEAVPTVKDKEARQGLVDVVNQYGASYLELFPEGKHRTEVQNAVALAAAQQ